MESNLVIVENLQLDLICIYFVRIVGLVFSEHQVKSQGVRRRFKTTCINCCSSNNTANTFRRDIKYPLTLVEECTTHDRLQYLST